MTLNLEAERRRAEETLTLLAAAERAASTLRGSQADTLNERQRQAALLTRSNEMLSQERTKSAEAIRKVTLLNAQMADLRSELNALQGILDASQADDQERDVQIETLGTQLNQALAQVAQDQKKLAEEEAARADEQAKIAALEAERAARLEEEAQDLRQYRSEFFARVRNILGEREGVRIVGDRFVFSSEVLFTTGSARLGPQGRAQISRVASVIRDVSQEIPDGINWILRVDGHTDNIPLSGLGEHRNNWQRQVSANFSPWIRQIRHRRARAIVALS